MVGADTLTLCASGSQMSGFGSVLRRLRRRTGLSQEALASRAGLSQDAISLLERGRREPRMTTLRLLAEAMNLSPSERAELFSAPDAVNRHQLPLPRFVDSLVGRDVELADLVAQLRATQPRLVTVTGPGGVGKTRLAVSAAQLIAAGPAVDHGVVDHEWGPVVGADSPATQARWLPLSSLRSPAAFLPAVGVALGLRDADQHGLGAIVSRLSQSPQLLVLDNAEHLIEECRAFCRAVLAMTDSVQLLVTSRRRLALPGESVLVLAPLSAPAVGTVAPDLASAPASRLFLERALPDPSVRLSRSDAAAVVRICRRLDGLPLALELAAARAPVMTLPELADRLDDTLGILPGPRSVGGPRHDRLLRDSVDDDDLGDAVVGWSFRLLSPEQQRTFTHLSVFSGFSHEAVTAVCSVPGRSERDLLEIVSGLVAQSLVTRARDIGGRARFRFLGLVRAYALELLELDPAAADVRHRHAAYYADLVDRAQRGMATGDPSQWLAVLDGEVSNIRAAVGWATIHEPELALAITSGVWRWCYLRGRYTEGRRWCESALAAGVQAPAELRGRVLAGAGMLAFLQCDYAEAGSMISAGLELAEQTGDDRQAGWCLARLGSLAREQGEYARAGDLHRQALDVAARLGDRDGEGIQHSFLAFVGWLSGDLDAAERHSAIALDLLGGTDDREAIVWVFINRGAIALYRDELGPANLLFQQALADSDELGFREGSAWAMNQLGVVARIEGAYDRGVALQQASLAEHRELGDRWREASVLDELAALALAKGDHATATARLGAADRLRSSIGAPVPQAERAARVDTEERCRDALGPTYRASLLAGALHQP